MKLPKLYSTYTAKTVSSPKKTYQVKDGVFEVDNFEDFYFFIKKGFRLVGDPKVKRVRNTNPFGMNDDEVLKAVLDAKKKTTVIQKDFEVIKAQLYEEYFNSVQLQIDSGKLEGYPVNLHQLADEYVADKLQEYEEKDQETLEEDNVEVLDEEVEEIKEEEIEIEEKVEEVKTPKKSKKRRVFSKKKRPINIDLESNADIEVK